MSISKLFFLSLFVFGLVGCSGDIFLVHNGNMPSSEKISQIRKGQNKAEVESVLGSPSAVTSFDNRTWIYMSSTLKKVALFKPEEMKRDVLAITFNDDGKVATIKNYDLEDGRQINVDTTATPTAGTQLGFFRKYFGGVGAYLPIAPSNSGDSL